MALSYVLSCSLSAGQRWPYLTVSDCRTEQRRNKPQLDFVVRTLAEGPSVMAVGAVLALLGGVLLLTHAIRQGTPWPPRPPTPSRSHALN